MSIDGSQIILGSHKQILTIPFMATLAANTNRTIVAGKLPFWYRITEAEIIFRDDANNGLLIYIFASRTNNQSSDAPPPDSNVFSQYSPTPYFVGEGLIKTVKCDYKVQEGEAYIKVYAANLNAYVQTVNVTVTVEEI